MRVAIYARVSTERQERQQTIDSQLSALRAWVQARDHALIDAHVFRDEGYSGSRLDRPGLDGLRDAVRDAAVDAVAVFSPDRLARKYAYQVLLLEEFRRADCEVVFLHHPISDNPNDQLLLQIQGAIAEYERTVLAERFRRGKLQKARDGHILSAKAPYGYRYETRCGALPARLVVDAAEADMVRQLYAWFVEEGLTIRQCLRRLNAGPWLTRSGRPQWSSSVAYHILSDPAYTGTAYSNRYEYVLPKKPHGRTRRSGERTCRRPRPPEQWIAIPVPVLIDQQTWERAKAQMARNAMMSFRRNKKHDYLLRCLLKCGTCGLGVHGCFFPGAQGRAGHRYYRCAGTDPLTTGREARCPRARIDADALEQAVWDHITGLLGSPSQLSAQFERFIAEADVAQTRQEMPSQHLRARLDRVDRADRRLLEAYQAEVISLAELAERRQGLAEQRRLAEQQLEHHHRLREQKVHAEDVLDSLAAFSERIGARLHDASVADRQALLQLVVERITVHDDHLEIQHVIPLRDPMPGPGTPLPVKPRLRSDGVAPARHLDQRGIAGRRGRLVERVETGVAVGMQEPPAGAKQCLRMHALAIGRVAVERRRRYVRTPGPLVAYDDPEPSGLGLAETRGEHRHGGVVGVQRGASADVAADRLGQRREQEHRLPDPIGQRRAVEVHALPCINPRLAVQRRVVAVLRHQHMRDQAGPRAAALDGQRRHRPLHDRLAGPAAQLRPDMLDDLEAGRDILEHLALVLAHPAEHRAAAARADAGRLVGDGLTRQMGRQRLAHRLLALARLRRVRLGGVSRAGAGVALGLLFLEFADQQFELLDVAVKLLRRPAEPRATQHGQLHLQLLDMQRLGMDLGRVGGDLDLLARQLRLQANGEHP